MIATFERTYATPATRKHAEEREIDPQTHTLDLDHMACVVESPEWIDDTKAIVMLDEAGEFLAIHHIPWGSRYQILVRLDA